MCCVRNKGGYVFLKIRNFKMLSNLKIKLHNKKYVYKLWIILSQKKNQTSLKSWKLFVFKCVDYFFDIIKHVRITFWL